MNEDTRGTTKHMMMLEANHYRFHKATSSCMATLDSRTSNHGFTTIKRYMRKSSSMTLNEALCGRQPDLFINLYKLWQVYIVFFVWKLQVTLYHCSNKYHNHMLYALNRFWVSTLLLDFWKICRPLIFVWLLVLESFLCFFREKYEARSLFILNLWLVNLG
jgi:hypothetical protein